MKMTFVLEVDKLVRQSWAAVRRLVERCFAGAALASVTVAYSVAPASATTITLYGHTTCGEGCPSHYGWNEPGGDIVMGQVEWVATNGSATFLVTLNSDLTIFGFSFNTTVPSSDFVLTTGESGWSYMGLGDNPNLLHMEFDHSLIRWGDYGSSNTLLITVTGAAIRQDSDFWRANDLFRWAPDSPTHFMAYAGDTARPAGSIPWSDGSVYQYGYMLSDAQFSSVPDSGSTLTMLSISVTAVAGFARRPGKRKDPPLVL